MDNEKDLKSRKEDFLRRLEKGNLYFGFLTDAFLDETDPEFIFTREELENNGLTKYIPERYRYAKRKK